MYYIAAPTKNIIYVRKVDVYKDNTIFLQKNQLLFDNKETAEKYLANMDKIQIYNLVQLMKKMPT